MGQRDKFINKQMCMKFLAGMRPCPLSLALRFFLLAEQKPQKKITIISTVHQKIKNEYFCKIT